MRRIGTLLRTAAAAAAALFSRSATVAVPPNAFNAADPVPRNPRPPRRPPGWATLVWDSGRLGPAYRVHDAQGRKLYVPLKSVPPDKRVPRRVRLKHEVGQRRGAAHLARVAAG